jgi:hypothetical protein
VVDNLDSKRTGPIEVDPKTWARFGYIMADERQDEDETLVEAA